MCLQIQMYRILFLLGFCLLGERAYGAHITPFWGGIEKDFQKGDYQQVRGLIRNNPEEIVSSATENQARLYLLATQDNKELFDDVQKEKESQGRFLDFLRGRGSEGFPMYLLRAFWNLKFPIGIMSGRAPFPDVYNDFFANQAGVAQNPQDGISILRDNPTHHSYYWLGHWYLGGDNILDQALGRGILVQLAKGKKHKNATEETMHVLKSIQKSNKLGWGDACAAWFLCPDRVCPAKNGIGYDFNQFDLRGCCGIGKYRGDDWCEVNCLIGGCRTKFHYKELWARSSDLCARIGKASRTFLMWTGGATSLAGSITALYGRSDDDDAVGRLGDFLALSGQGLLLVAYTSFPTEDDKQGKPTAPVSPYVFGSQERADDRTSMPPSAYSSRYPSAQPTRAPTTVPLSHEEEEPPPGDSLLRQAVRRSIKSLRDLRRSWRTTRGGPVSPVDLDIELGVHGQHIARPLAQASIITQPPKPQEDSLSVQENMAALGRGLAEVLDYKGDRSDLIDETLGVGEAFKNINGDTLPPEALSYVKESELGGGARHSSNTRVIPRPPFEEDDDILTTKPLSSEL